MRFYGFQKMTLLDFPGKVACTLFTGGCNMRCPFCHNALLVTELEQGNDTWDEAEVLTFLRRRKGLLDGVCVTGGEPTLQPELAPFLRRVKELGYAVKLDTNGTRPEVLRALVGEGLVDYVAMDVKNSPARYALTAGVPAAELSGVFTSMDFLLSGTVDYEFRTTGTAHGGGYCGDCRPDCRSAALFPAEFQGQRKPCGCRNVYGAYAANAGGDV